MHAEAALVRTVTTRSPIAVRPLAPKECDQWETFVDQCRDATFFHRIGWRDIIEDVFGHRCHYLVAERDGKWTGVLPLAAIRSWLFGHALVSLPFAVYGGPAANDHESARALISAAEKLAQELGVDYLELRNTRTHCAQWPQQPVYVTFRTEIVPGV